jgi:hypothetical protein
VGRAGAHLVRRGEHRTEAEVDDLDVALVVEQHVLRLQVAVDHQLPMARVHGGHHLGKEAGRLGLLDLAALDDVREELAAAHVLRHLRQARNARLTCVRRAERGPPETLPASC